MRLNTEKIEDLLWEKRMTKADLASKLGVSRQSISYYLSLEEGVTLNTITKLAKALNIKDPKELILS